MFRVFLLLAVALAFPCADAQVIYLKPSELWAYEFGRNTGEAVRSMGEFRGFMLAREGDYAKVAALRQKAASCGNCADRDRLVNEANRLEAELTQFDELLCGAFDVGKQIGPSAGAVSKLVGVEPICERLKKKQLDAEDRAYLAKHVKRIQAGDLDGYKHIGMWYLEDRSRPAWSQRANLGCPYLYRGAQLGNVPSLTNLVERCLMEVRSTEDERKEGVKMLKACSEKGANPCTYLLGYMYSEFGNRSSSAPFQADNTEALRLWDLSAARGDTLSAGWAQRLRVRMAPAIVSVPSTTQPARPATPVSPPPLDERIAPLPAQPRSPSAYASGRQRETGQLSNRCKGLAAAVERLQRAASTGRSHESRLASAEAMYARTCP